MKLWIQCALFVALCLGGCVCPKVPDGMAAKELSTGFTERPPTLEEVRNLTFNGVLEGPVTLKGGVFEGPLFIEGGISRLRVMLWSRPVAFGDLDGIAGDEAAVFLSRSSGGSGEFIFVAAVATVNGRPVNLGTAPVGDRTKIRALHIDRGTIVMEVVEAGPQDPACCPTQLARKRYMLRGDALKLKSSVVNGTLSIETLAGTEWTLVELDGNTLPEGVRPPTATFVGKRIAGFGGCNRYTGEVRETAAGSISIGTLAGTRMACPDAEMSLEDRFLKRLSAVERYTFLGGRLALVSRDGGSQQLLLFSDRPQGTGALSPPEQKARE